MGEQRERGPTRTALRGVGIPGQRAVPHLPRRGSIPLTTPPQVLAAAAGGRGLPASGAIALAVGAGVGGGAVDVLTGAGLRSMFAVTFVLGCLIATALVRRQSLLAAVVTPPLAYVGLAMAAATVQRDSSSTSWVMRQTFELLTALITGAPVLIAATLAAAAVAVTRLALQRRPTVVQLPPR